MAIRLAELYGLHDVPGLTAGHLATRTGAVMASEDVLGAGVALNVRVVQHGLTGA